MSAAEALSRVRRMTYAEYLVFEETSEQKHEFHDGEVLAMSGGTESHSLVTVNTMAAIHSRLRGSECRIYEGNMRVAIKSRSRYVYPDSSVVCGERKFDPDDPNRTTLLNPTLVIETLSKSTANYDRGEKFEAYREIESMREYVLIAQGRPHVESFFRDETGRWIISSWHGMDEVAALRSVNVELPLAEVYLDVEFPSTIDE